MNVLHNNKPVYFVWWPFYAFLLFALIILAMFTRAIEAVLTFMEIDE
jgi:hypothetical protein